MKWPASHGIYSTSSHCTRIRLRTVILMLLLLINLYFGNLSANCFAQKKTDAWQHFFHKQDQFSLHFPPELKPIVPKQSPARLILVPETGKIPSVNVLTFAGKYPLHSSLNSLGLRLTGEYQQAGLQDTYVQKIEKRTRPDGTHFLFAQLIFSKQGIKQLSTVSIFSAEKKHFVVTCILPLDSDTTKQETCDRIVTSLTSPLLEIHSNTEEFAEPPFSIFYYVLGGLLLLVLLLGYRNNVSEQ